MSKAERRVTDLMYWLREDLYRQCHPYRQPEGVPIGRAFGMENPPGNISVILWVADGEHATVIARVNGEEHISEDVSEAWLDEVLP